MAATAAIQQNTTNGRGIYFIGIERRFRTPSSGLTPSACFQSGLLAVTNKVDAEGNKINTITRQEIKELINVSPATVSRNNKRFENSGRIRKQGVSTYVFGDDVAECEKIKKWYCPTEILTQPFPAEDDEGNTFFINLTYCDGLVYALIYTLLPHTGENKRTLKMTFKEMAETLDIDESTVSDSIRKLRMAGLIRFPNGWCGKNRYKKSRIQLKRGFSWFKREREYRALLDKKKAESPKSEPEQKAPKTPHTPPLNRAEARQRYYSGLQAGAAQKAAQALEKALKNNDFRNLNAEYTETKYNYNSAIIRNNEAEQRELSLKIKDIEEKRACVLKNIGIKPEELDVEYYVTCTECNDTGARADGSACDCWKARRRGSPPGNGKRTTKGTE